MIAALAHGLLGTVLAVLLGLFAALVPQRPPAPAYTGPDPLVVVQPSHPVVGKPVTLTIAGLPRAAQDVRVSGLAAGARKLPSGAWRIAASAPKIPGPWMVTVVFRLHGRTDSVAGAVVAVGLPR